MKMLSALALLLAPLATIAGPTDTILTNIGLEPTLSTLATVLALPDYSAIAAALDTPSATLTLFAPNNAAFAAANLNVSYVDLISNTLLYHAIGAKIPSSDLTGTNFVDGLSNASAYVTLGGDYQTFAVYVNGSGTVTTSFGIPGVNKATVVTADIESSNGWIHIIDAVQMFPALTSATATTAGLSTLVSAVSRVGLVSAVDTTPNVTIFAPTNAAFTAAGGIAQFSDPALTTILTYHVVPGRYFSTDLVDGQELTTVQGQKLTVNLVDGEIQGARSAGGLVITDVLTKNGVVHVIDGVLLPSTNAFTIADLLVQIPELSTLGSVVTSAPYQPVEDALNSAGPFTLFGPNNAAFQAANVDTSAVATVTQVLLYHTVPGNITSGALAPANFVATATNASAFVTLGGGYQAVGVYQAVAAGSGFTGVTTSFGIPGVNESNVVTADILASNGVIHIIDTVENFPAQTSATAVSASLDSLVAALSATNLVGTVDNTPNITIFAPTDAAFAAIAPLALSTTSVSNVLKYHVVAGRWFSTELIEGQVLTTVFGETLTVSAGKVGVQGAGAGNSAGFELTDVITKNGVVHVINKVLIPSSAAFTIADNIKLTPALETLADVITTAAYQPVEDALNSAGPFTLFGPNDAAFQTANINTSDVDTVTQVLLYHAVQGKFLAADLAATNFVPTASNASAFVTLGGDYQTVGVYKSQAGAVTTSFGIPGVNKATVVTANIISANGVIHVIDTVESFPALTSATAVAAGLDTLVEAVVRTDLVSAVDETPKITIFAPTDAAFAAAGGIDIFSDAALSTILTYHVVAGRYFSNQLTNGQELTTLQGQKLTFNAGKINGARSSANISVADVITKNGVVHVIDGVLLPSTAAFTIADLLVQYPALSILNSVVSSAPYQPVEDALNSNGPFTLFAPNDAAFGAANVDTAATAVVTQVLLYHAVVGSVPSTALAATNFAATAMADPAYVTLGTGVAQSVGVYKATSGAVTTSFGIPGTNKSTVVTADIQASNGYIHIIDTVENLPATTSATATTAGLTSLVSAVVEAGLVSAVDTTPNVTIFAPNNAAFTAAGGLDALDAKYPLDVLLQYHVVPGRLFSTQLVNGQVLRTLANKTITYNAGRITAEKSNAGIALADVITKNGVVHVIDGVLLFATSSATALKAGLPVMAVLFAALNMIRGM